MKAKKILSVLFALFLISPVMHGQKSVDKLFSDFSKEKGVERVSVGKLTMTFAGFFKNLMGVNGIEVLSFNECGQSVKKKLNKEIASLKDANYETMVSANEEKENTKILVKLQDEFIEEIVVLTTGENPAMVRIKGKIKPSDIENVINKTQSDKE